MTLFTIVSIVLSICGSTFAALNQMSARWANQIKGISDQFEIDLKISHELLPAGHVESEKVVRRSQDFATWKSRWDASGVFPILTLLIFSVSAAVVVEYTMITSTGTAPSQVSSTALTLYRVILPIILIVNIGSLAIKFVSRKRIVTLGGEQQACASIIQAALKKQTITPISTDLLGPTFIGPRPEERQRRSSRQ